MGDVRLLVKRLGLGGRSQQVEAKAFEYLRLANARLGYRALGNAEVCKAAVCVDLACTMLQVPFNASVVVLGSGVTNLVYKNARAMLQKTLNVRGRASVRDLCLQFGCMKIEAPTRSALATFKECFLQQLPADREKTDLSDQRYLAAVFFLVGRKHRVKVARDRLLSGLGLTSKEFNQSVEAVGEMLPDLMGASPGDKKSSGKKRKEKGEEQQKSNATQEDIEEEREEEVEEDGTKKDADSDIDENAAAGDYKPKRQRKQKTTLTEKMLRQAVLGFAAEENARTTRSAYKTNAAENRGLAGALL